MSVGSLWAEERAYYPLEVEPYTPAHHFEGGKNDPKFRTKLKIARQLVESSVMMGWALGRWSRTPSTAKTGGSSAPWASRGSATFWRSRSRIRGGTRRGPSALCGRLPWRLDGGAPRSRGSGRRLRAPSGTGDREDWWALEVEAGPYGKERARRALVVTTDPAKLPDLATWYLTTNLPAPDSERENEEALAPASVAEVVRLYGLRMWVEQSYKQVKHALG